MKIIIEWIEEEKHTFVTDIKEALIHYGQTSVADYFASLGNKNNMYFNNNIYCYKYLIWVKSSNEVYLNLKI